MKITAAVLDRMVDRLPYATTRPLRLAELELDAPRAGELLVRIDAAGLCHSDLSVINGDRPRPTPMALGHEAAATVLEAGDPDSPFKPGDKVVLAFLPACGHCVACSSGEGYLCGPGAAANGEGRLLRGGRRLHEHGGEVQHHLGVSAFATHAVVDQRSAVKIDAGHPARDRRPVRLRGADRRRRGDQYRGGAAGRERGGLWPGRRRPGRGAGRAGGRCPAGDRHRPRCLRSAPWPWSWAPPRPLRRTRRPKPSRAPRAAEAPMWWWRPPAGPPCSLPPTPPRAGAGARSPWACRRRARCCRSSAVSLVGDGKTLMGSYMGSSIPSRDVPRYIALWRAGRLPVERLLTSVSPLSDINARMDELASGRAVRQIVLPHA